MPKINGLNQFLAPAQDAFLYQLVYNKVYGGNTGCSVNINGTNVQMGANSSIDILVKNISGGTGCLLSGDRPYVYGNSPQYKYVPQTFVSVWDTSITSAGSSTATQVRLPLISTGTYNFIVDWGDGTTDRITTWNQAQTTHTYASAGVYQVTITGTIQGFRFANTGDRLKILSIFKWGVGFRLGATDQHFNGCANLDLSEVEDVLDLTETTSFASSFRACTRLTEVRNMNSWNTTNITSLNQTFQFSPNFNTNIGDWNTENVTDMSRSFDATGGASSTTQGKFNQYIGNWNTSKVTTLRTMFFNQSSFNQDISTKQVTVGGVTYTAWDTLNVIDMGFVFACSGNIGTFNQNIGNWNTSKVTGIQSMFQTQINFNQDISTKVVTVNGVTYTAWDTLNVTNMAFVLSGAGAIGVFNQNIGNWNTSKVTNMQSMIASQSNFNQDISTKLVTVGANTYTAWDTLNVTNMSFMFNVSSGIAGTFNQNIGNWNTSKVTTMNSMFARQILFNQDISTKEVTVGDNTYTAWDTLNVTNMGFMFNAFVQNSVFGKFNQNIGNWNTSKVTRMDGMFQVQANFNQDISTKVVTVGGSTYTAWNTLNVTNMNFMLFGSFPESIGIFNQTIENWNTSKVTTMNSIFNRQPLFNQDISTKTVTVGASTYTAWDTLNVTVMSSMFFIASDATSSFNQNIGNWNTAKVTNMSSMLFNTTNFNQNLENWNVSLVTLFNSTTTPEETFADGIGLSTANYDALLIGWSSRPVQPNLPINFGTVKYSSAAIPAREILTSEPNNWTIVDGGLE